MLRHHQDDIFEKLAKFNVRPLDVDVEFSANFENNMPECKKCIDFFNETVKNTISSKR